MSVMTPYTITMKMLFLHFVQAQINLKISGNKLVINVVAKGVKTGC